MIASMTLDHDVYSLHAAALRQMTEQLKAQSALLREQVIPIIIQGRVPPPRRQPQHQWTSLAVGRVCTVCRTSQANGEFDDEGVCRP